MQTTIRRRCSFCEHTVDFKILETAKAPSARHGGLYRCECPQCGYKETIESKKNVSYNTADLARANARNGKNRYRE